MTLNDAICGNGRNGGGIWLSAGAEDAEGPSITIESSSHADIRLIRRRGGFAGCDDLFPNSISSLSSITLSLWSPEVTAAGDDEERFDGGTASRDIIITSVAAAFFD